MVVHAITVAGRMLSEHEADRPSAQTSSGGTPESVKDNLLHNRDH